MQNPIYLIRRIIGGHKREEYKKRANAKLLRKDFSVFAPACIGGVVTSDMGVRFLSPTVNLAIRMTDFIKMMENLPYYMSLTPKKAPREGHLYPVITVGDIKVYCVHYHLYKTAINKWVERAKRVNYDNVCIISGWAPFEDEELLKRFEALPYKKLVITDYEKAPDKPYVAKLKPIKRGRTSNIFNFKNFKGERFYDEYDFTEFFNRDIT